MINRFVLCSIVRGAERHLRVLIFFTIPALLSSGCAAPQKIQEEAAIFLYGKCLTMFTEGGPRTYQYRVSRDLKNVFALSDDGRGKQWCAISANTPDEIRPDSLFSGPNTIPWEKVEVVAIARCEAIKPAGAPPCRVFAHNNDIV